MSRESRILTFSSCDNPHPEITEESARDALHEHLRLRAAALRAKYENQVNAETVMRMLGDPDALRFPVELRFRSEPLEPGEFAYPYPIEDDPSGRWILCLHPYFKDKLGALPALIAYHIPTINYGPIITSDEAELFGATLLGMEIDNYYHLVCDLVDAMVREVLG